MEKKAFELDKLTRRQRHGLLLAAVAPRPIAWVSTVDKDGHVNLSPFSFFNAFSTSPPIMIFSPGRRGRDSGIKNTHENVLEVPEVAISVVGHDMVQQMSLTSNDYEKGVNEFIKAGLTMVPSQKIKPPGVAESPVIFECVVNQVIPLGQQGGSGNLVIAEVLLMHVDNQYLSGEYDLDITRLDLIGRMGGNWYSRAFGDALFEVPKPTSDLAIGLDQLPKEIRDSKILSGNDLGRLGSMTAVPSSDALEQILQMPEVINVTGDAGLSMSTKWEQIQLLGKQWIQQDQTANALALMLAYTDR
ncbi:MAG: flavin reductase family protein [Saprospiraceae bacterium]|nr:flavin reductase family protein [Saprospiraceae bacterium]